MHEIATKQIVQSLLSVGAAPLDGVQNPEQLLLLLLLEFGTREPEMPVPVGVSYAVPAQTVLILERAAMGAEPPSPW